MTKEFEVKGFVTEPRKMKMIPEKFIVMATNDEIGKSMSIFSMTGEIGYQIPITDELLKMFKGW